MGYGGMLARCRMYRGICVRNLAIKITINHWKDERQIQKGVITMTNFAERMMEAMIDFGINQTELAEKTGITKGALSSYLSGRYEPKRDNLQKIAKALDVDEGWLMGYDAVDSFAFQQKVIDSLNRIEKTLLRNVL